MIIIDGQCERCRHLFSRPFFACSAFPDGVPGEMIAGTLFGELPHDHRQPFPGDNGIRFELLPGKRHPLDVIQEGQKS